MGGIFASIEKQDSINESEAPEEAIEKKANPLTVEEILPPPEVLRMLKENNKLNLPEVEQRKVLNAVLEEASVDQVKSKVQEIVKKDDISELTNLASAVLQHSRGASGVASKLYELAMELGDDNAAYTYASLLLKGITGLQRDVQRATTIFERLAIKGHPHAQFNYASILIQTGRDVKSAMELLELAGKNNLDVAYAKIADMYRLGQHVEQDIPKAIEYFRKAAEKGSAQSNFYLGYYYSIGQDPLTTDNQPNYEKAFEHYEKAAVKGIAEAQYNVGQYYFGGVGVEKNLILAAEYWKMAAAQKFPLALYNLGVMYLEGNGVGQDLDLAREHLIEVSKLGGSLASDALEQLSKVDDESLRKGSGKGCLIM
ncbi:HCP-like protein [Basidiobolus meristosporus CBS 931.73]|uniref:HCP-like protein n=1 Tax=Basidiobolus meristosporus CBS 931.73 TaxID=1314790 RepID=A0A1Y1YJT8_9FUNG|nr:HCP-like protein [Basidiobolus meristosporus CBS 931.73]|eukprot:ORX98232.1 HCP-like protein [Basidiobolus meristosporus CBS 931.73]